MKIAIVMTTYLRSDGQTAQLLQRAIDSISNQKHIDWHLYLIGDRYENNREFIRLSKTTKSRKVTAINLELAQERDNNYPPSMLWKFGGVNARNFGISLAAKDGYEWIAQIDHDDYWEPNHLSEINQIISNPQLNPSFVFTVSTYKNENSYLPLFFTYKDVVESMPIPEGMIHSSVCMKVKDLKNPHEVYTDMYRLIKDESPNSTELNNLLPADAYLWRELSEHYAQKGLKSYLINKVTCQHIEEGFELNK